MGAGLVGLDQSGRHRQQHRGDSQGGGNGGKPLAGQRKGGQSEQEFHHEADGRTDIGQRGEARVIST